MQIINFIEFKEVKSKISSIDEAELRIIKTQKEIESIRTDYLSTCLDLYVNLDIDIDKQSDLGVSRLISSIVLQYKLQPNMPYAYISAYQVLYCQLIKLKCLSDKPYHYEEFKSINYNITDSSSLAVVKLHIDCIDRIEKIKEWLPAEAH